MSQEDHPNFHAVKCLTEVYELLEGCLRGKASGKLPRLIQRDEVKQHIRTFVDSIEAEVDAMCNGVPSEIKDDLSFLKH